MGRPLTAAEAAAALGRGAQIEQFVELADGRVTYLAASRLGGEYTVRRHVVLDEGTEEFRDLSEFSPVDEDEYIGEGVVVARVVDAVDAVSAAENYGGSRTAWVNFGVAADDYWAARTHRG